MGNAERTMLFVDLRTKTKTKLIKLAQKNNMSVKDYAAKILSDHVKENYIESKKELDLRRLIFRIDNFSDSED